MCIIISLLVNFQLDIGLGSIAQYKLAHLLVSSRVRGEILYGLETLIVAVDGFGVLERDEVGVALLLELFGHGHLFAQATLDHD